jgi:GT2 family glycosyltransferase
VFIFLDSDCTVPPTWLAAVTEGRMRDSLQAFGGPDREHPDFSVTQKAISYAMTSLLTTGGIRGGRVRVGGAFHPRSFNMGMDREVYATTRGFSAMRFGEDIDLSIRMMKGGYRVGLIPEAWVYHKRRTDFGKFFKQVHNSGMARINLTVRHPGTLKITHFFPTAVTLYLLFAVVCAALTPFGIRYGWAALIPIAVYAVLLFAHATIAHRSLHVGVLSVAASAVQLVGYGTGFIRGMVWRVFLGKPETQAFKGTFYK